MVTTAEDQERLLVEHILGRWQWKTGDLRAGGVVPWEIELSNFMPDNFIWEKDKTSILTITAGYYEVSLALFSRKRPSATLNVNG
jgi:hypothetical protein